MNLARDGVAGLFKEFSRGRGADPCPSSRLAAFLAVEVLAGLWSGLAVWWQ